MASASRTSDSYEYVLGDSAREAQRLERQAALWDPVAGQLFDRIGVRPGWRVLEIGPGRGSVHAELRRRVQGPIDAVERSAAFADAVRARATADGFGEGQIWETDLLAAALPSGAYDLIYARWVFCFLPDPLAHVEKLAAALKPGGLLALQDYGHRESFALLPRPAEWLDFLAADRAFFASQGGDISIGGQLPGAFARAGLALLEMHPTLMSGRRGSLVWDWLFGYFDSVRDRLAGIPPLDDEKTRRLGEQWRDAAASPHAFVFAPTVVDLIARRDA